MGSPTPDGERFCSVAETLVTARAALADPAAPAREPIVLVLSHVSTVQRLLDDATGLEPLATALSAHRASARRVRRMLQLFARTTAGDRRARRMDSGTLRTTVAQLLKAHLHLERELLSRIDSLLSPADLRVLTVRYQRLMEAGVVAPRWSEILDRSGRRDGRGAARLRVLRFAGGRRGPTDGAAAVSEGASD